MTSERLRIDMKDRHGRPLLEKYDNFVIGNEDEKFKFISLGSHTGKSWYSYKEFCARSDRVKPSFVIIFDIRKCQKLQMTT